MIGLGIGLPFAQRLGDWQGILDTLGLSASAIAVAELRLLTKTYKGPLVQVVRDAVEGGSVSSLTCVGTTATVNFTALHSFITGELAEISGATQAGYNTIVAVTVLSPTSISYAVPAGTATPATGTIVVNKAKDIYPTDKAMKPTGQYVMVRRTGTYTDAWFEIGDLKVISNGSNVALGKSVTASHTPFSGTTLAGVVDGVTSINVSVNLNNMYSTSTTSTDAWVQVDLGATYEISEISVYVGYLSVRYGGANIYLSSVSMSDALESTYAANPLIHKINAAPLNGTTAVGSAQTFKTTAQRWIDTTAVKSFSNGENLLLQSQSIGTAPWSAPNGATATLNTALAPDGTMTASRLSVGTGGTGAIWRQAITTVAGSAYAFPIWLKCESGTVSSSIYIEDGASPWARTLQNVTLTTTWQRFNVTRTVAGTSANFSVLIDTAGVSSILAWQGQANTGSVAKADQKTTTSAVFGNCYVSKLYDQSALLPASILRGWMQDGAALSVISDAMRVTNTGANGEAYISFATVVGRSYTLSLTVSSGTSSAPSVYLSNAAPNAYTGALGISYSTGSVSLSFVASAAHTYVRLENRSAGIGDFSEYKNVKLIEFNSGVPTTIYDQSSGNVLSQPDKTKRGQIVTAGVLNTANGRPTINWSVGQFLYSAALKIDQTALSMTATLTNVGGHIRAVHLMPLLDDANEYLRYNGDGLSYPQLGRTQRTNFVNAGIPNSGSLVFSHVNDGVNHSLYRNGLFGASGAVAGATQTTPCYFQAGSFTANGVANSGSGYGLWLGALPVSIRQALERDAGTAYGISVA
jgi:hypothetical protein